MKNSKASLSKRGNKNPMFGKTHTADARLKIGEAHKGQVSPFKGRHLSVGAKEKVSKSHSGINHFNCNGDKNPNWKGGITPIQAVVRNSIEYRLWREAVFARDNWTCQKCGNQGGDLHSHHVKAFSSHPELRLAIDNGMTLCLVCHRQTYNQEDINECKANETL